MYSLKMPKVTGYFIRHVDCSNLRVETETNVRLSHSARRALGVHKQENLNVVLGKIQGYQMLHPAKYEISNLDIGIPKASQGEAFGFMISVPLLIEHALTGVVAGATFLFSEHHNLDHVNFLPFLATALASVTLFGITSGIYSSRRNAACDLLHYFVEANKNTSTQTV